MSLPSPHRPSCFRNRLPARADKNSINRETHFPAVDGSRPARNHHSKAGTALSQPQIHRNRSRSLVRGAHREVQRDLPRRAEPRPARSSRHRRSRGRRSKNGWQQFCSRTPVGRSDRDQSQHQHKRSNHYGWMERLYDPGPRAGRAQRCDHHRQAARRGSRHSRANQYAGFRGQRHQPQHRLRTHRQCLRRSLQPRRLLRWHSHSGHFQLRGAGQWNRHRQLHPHAVCDKFGRRCFPHARSGEHRRHRARSTGCSTTQVQSPATSPTPRLRSA